MAVAETAETSSEESTAEALAEVIDAMEQVDWADVESVGVMEASVWNQRCQEALQAEQSKEPQKVVE